MAYGTLVENDPIILGSGELYLGMVKDNMTEEEINEALTNIGAIEAGATLKYEPQFTEITSANRGVIANFITKEVVTFGTGILTWNLENIARLTPGKIVHDDVKRSKTLTIGGQGKMPPVNYLRFVHTKENGDTITVNIMKATSTKGFEFTFDSENPMSINYEFVALADKNGTLVEIVEQEFIAEEI